MATMCHSPHTSQVATLATNRRRSTTPQLWLCSREQWESSIDSMDGSLHILKDNLKLFVDIRKVRHRETIKCMTYLSRKIHHIYIYHICHTSRRYIRHVTRVHIDHTITSHAGQYIYNGIYTYHTRRMVHNVMHNALHDQRM